ncbi:MAG: cupin domain-containing protein [Clostridia bacterium]|nr:cupin domain-containing protein [Clostridia bacterium]
MATIVDKNNVKKELVSDSGAEGLEYQTLIPQDQGRLLRTNFVTVHPGGMTRNHKHDWEQVNYILAGKGVLIVDENENEPMEIQAGMAIHIPGGEAHYYKNISSEPLVMLGVLGPMPALK